MELEDIINRVSANSDIRVIVVGSRLAKFFTAGLDVTQPSVLGRGSDLDAARRALAIRGHLTVSNPTDEIRWASPNCGISATYYRPT